VVCGDARFSSEAYSRRVCAEMHGLPIQFLGWRDDASAVLSALDLLVVPSALTDATPLVILEAFSAGVPVVAFRSGGIPEIVEDGVTGVLCPPDPAQLACVLLEMMQRGRTFVDSLARQAKAAFAKRFSLERYQSEVLQVVRGAI